MPDVVKILNLVAEGKLSAQEADEILAALNAREAGAAPESSSGNAQAARTTHLRIEVTDGGRQVVNLRVPINIAGWASTFLPGLSEQDSDRIRGAVASGTRGTILDVTDDDGSRVLITSE
jgi:SHOCT-like protein